jgi:hypothetical protein
MLKHKEHNTSFKKLNQCILYYLSIINCTLDYFPVGLWVLETRSLFNNQQAKFYANKIAYSLNINVFISISTR